ncbi:MAG: hypothetical protein ACOC8F_00105 [Planctomycetota bacterium]
MQVRCGQCGTLFRTDRPLAESACPNCGHPVAADPEATRTEPAPEQDAGAGFAEIARKHLGQALHITCGKCGRHLTVGARRAGHEGRCPSCGGRIRIPRPQAEGEDEPALPQTAPDAPERLRMDLAGDWEIVAADHPARVEVVRRRRPLVVILASLVVAGAGVGLWIGLGVLGGPASDEAPRAPVATDGQRPVQHDDGGADAPPTPPRRPEPSEPPDPTAAPPKPPKPPETAPQSRPAPAKCALVATEAALFAADGYRPAPPGRAYWRATVRLTAGDEPWTLHAKGGDVRLKSSEGVLRALGLATEDPLRDGPARAGRISVPPGGDQTVTFVFEGPEAPGESRLEVRRATPVALGTLAMRGRTAPRELPATFVERGPRNLRPGLRDPVMAALQSTGRHELRLARDGEALKVSIPAAEVAGRATRRRPGLWDATLRVGSEELDCALRFFADGRRAILYLSAAPFHQLSYERRQ